MWNIVIELVAVHSMAFVVAAALICAISGWLLGDFLERSRGIEVGSSRWWLMATVTVAGLGTWTTHFMAMLGYRNDVVTVYDAFMTMSSLIMAIVAVGVPLAISTRMRRLAPRIAMGAVSGLGIGAMHFTGMKAIEGCIQSQSGPATLVAFAVGATCMAVLAGRSRLYGRGRSALLYAAAVCGTHFVAVSGTSLTRSAIEAIGTGHHLVLAGFTFAATTSILVAAAVSLMVAKRFDRQEKAHSTILDTALQNMSNGLLFVDESDRIGLFNQRFLDMFGFGGVAVRVGMPAEEFVDRVAGLKGWSAERRALAMSRLRDWTDSTQIATAEYVLEGNRVIEAEFQPVHGGGTVVTFDDVTNDRRTSERIEKLAFNDPLTGLANRRALQDRMEEGFAPKRRYKLLLIDLDRFKSVNDTYGHAVGDKLLIQVADRIRGTVGPNDYVARLGGDEMATLVYGDHERAMEVADAVVGAIGARFHIDDLSISVGCSIGLCCTDDASTPEELMQRSDLALYESKRNGRGRTTCYRPGLQEAAADRRRMEEDLANALENGEFRLVYQPVLSLAEDRVVGYEALIRWHHPERGVVSPGEFIVLAEETGQIVGIGLWVLGEACREAATWPSDMHVAVNVSSVQFSHADVVDHVMQALEGSGLDPRQLEIELTETAIVEDGSRIADVLGHLRSLGVRIAMDDFGTGYSSLAHLRDFPLDRIKIDRSFVADAGTEVHSLAVLRAITQLGRDMGIPTLAEGVETKEQLALLRSLGCDAVQGYLTGRPGPVVHGERTFELAA